jgi:23S rRNA U2552 (ribose-2'-O)-methylase RlmE/FtsJ
MKPLSAIGTKLGTDKVDASHSFQGVSLLDIYQQYFGPCRHLVQHVLELGVWQGASLRVWRDYFPSATIWGVDINPEAAIANVPRLHTVIGSQAHLGTLNRVASGQVLDIVIDDGSHVVEHMLESLRLLWPRVRPGGFYVIEDTHTTYHDLTQWKDVWPGQHLNASDTRFSNSRDEFMQVIAEQIRDMDQLRGNCAFVHFWPRTLVMQKAIT